MQKSYLKYVIPFWTDIVRFQNSFLPAGEVGDRYGIWVCCEIGKRRKLNKCTNGIVQTLNQQSD